MVAGMVLVSILGIAANPSVSKSRNVVDTVDLIELNHLHDECGKHTIDQVIFYEWSPDYRRFDVISYRLIEDDISKLPVRLPGNREYSVAWYDREARAFREVRSRHFRETWTKTDPEQQNKRVLDEKCRSSLRQPNGRSRAKAHTQ